MSMIQKLKAKLASIEVEQLPEVGQPMLDRIENAVAGGMAAVWCQASWGEGCDAVNVAE